MKAIRYVSLSVSLRGTFNCVAIKLREDQCSLYKGMQLLWDKAVSTRLCRKPFCGCICCEILSDTIFTVVRSLQLALAPRSEGIQPSNRVWQVSLQYKGLGHHKLSSVCCRQLTYCVLVYIRTYINLLFYWTFLNCALFLSLAFFLLSYHSWLHQLLCLILTYLFLCRF